MGRSLTEDWGRDIRTTMGLAVHGYPNLLTTAVPLAPSAALCNMTTCLQQQTEWISDAIRHVREQGKSTIEPTKDGEDAWVAHHEETADATLIANTTVVVPGLQRAGQAAPGAVLHRGRGHLPAEVRRGGRPRLPAASLTRASHRPTGAPADRRPIMSKPIDGSAIDKVLQSAVDDGAVPHVAAIAADRDGVIYEGGAGAPIVGQAATR